MLTECLTTIAIILVVSFILSMILAYFSPVNERQKSEHKDRERRR